MKLRHKFTLTIISASLVLSIAFMGFFTYWSKVETENKISRTFFLRNTHITNQINLYIQECISNLEDVAEYTESNYKKVPVEVVINKFYEFRNLQKVFQNIKLYDIKGIKLIDTNGLRLNRVSDIHQFSSQGQNRKVIYYYNEDPETRIKVISFAKIILDKEQNPIALIVADLPLASLGNLVRALVTAAQADEGLALELIKENGEILYSNYTDGFLAENIIKTSEQKRQGDDQAYVFFQDEKSFFSVSKSMQSSSSQGVDWYLVIKMNKDVAFKRIEEGTKMLILITFIIMIVFSLISYRIVSTITQPIENASLALAEMGNGNFRPILDVKITNDEYGELIIGLQGMTKKVDSLIKDQVSKYRLTSLGNMASNIAHEINNPLHLINNHAILLKKMLTIESLTDKDDFEKEKIKRSLNAVTDTVMRISKIISGMKALSKDGANDEFEASPLSSILDGTLTLCDASLKNREIILKINKPPDDFIIECRSVQIQQVLLNLINNAADAIVAQDDKWIEINVSENRDGAKFEIINSGEKISKEIASNLFTPFYTTKIKGSETGLGLSISKSIVTSHHGTIELDLGNVYTCFMFQIPRIQKNTKNEVDIAV